MLAEWPFRTKATLKNMQRNQLASLGMAGLRLLVPDPILGQRHRGPARCPISLPRFSVARYIYIVGFP
jgi:hypothetical protein